METRGGWGAREWQQALGSGGWGRAGETCSLPGTGPVRLSSSKHSELLPNTNGLVSRAGGRRSCYRPQASGPQPDPSPVSPFRL